MWLVFYAGQSTVSLGIPRRKLSYTILYSTPKKPSRYSTEISMVIDHRLVKEEAGNKTWTEQTQGIKCQWACGLSHGVYLVMLGHGRRQVLADPCARRGYGDIVGRCPQPAGVCKCSRGSLWALSHKWAGKRRRSGAKKKIYQKYPIM